MRATIIGCFALLTLAHTACAAVDEFLPTLKIGNHVYTNVTVTTVTATDICFVYPHGIGNAKLKDLEPALQKQFHYDPTKVAPPAPPPNWTTPPRAVAANSAPAQDLHARSFLNQRAPTFVVEKWLTAEPDLHGKFLLVDFWATWCGPCKRAIPELNGLYAKYKDQVVFVGLSSETEEAVRKLAEPHMDYYVAIDPQRRMSSEIRNEYIPYTMLIDPNGIVRFEGHPARLDENTLHRLVADYSR
jgi:cytochrome c biogenesis protein CcmG/thiol:disulfide interchange protein DsbE